MIGRILTRLAILAASIGIGAGVYSYGGQFFSAKRALVGVWDVSFEMTGAELSRTGLTAHPLLAAGQKLLSAAQTDMQLELRDDDTLSVGAQVLGHWIGQTGTWRAKRHSREEYVVTAHLSSAKAPADWQIRFVDDNTFQLTPPPDSPFRVEKLLTFRRRANTSPPDDE